MKKIIFLSLLLVAVSAAFPLHSFADPGEPGHTHPETAKTVRTAATNSAALRSVTSKISATTRKQRVLAEIDRRIALLEEASKKIEGLTHITATEKSTLQTTIHTAITNLQTLKTNISGNNNEASLIADIKTLITTHKNFSIALPQARLLVAAELMDALANRMLEVIKKVEVRVTALEASGTETGNISSLILNLKAKLADVKAVSNSITAAVTPLASDSDASKTTLKTAQGKLKAGMQDLRDASKDLREILKELRELTPEETNSGTPSAE